MPFVRGHLLPVLYMVGRSIGHYEIQEELGAGGMGIVYKAFDTRLRRFVAIKAFPRRYNSETAKALFLREAQVASALNHPNIVTVFDIGDFEDAPYIVMEFADGQTLGRLIPPRGMIVRDAHAYAMQLADALAAAHKMGIIHRDLKPSNIIVSPSGKVTVLDFGLAKFLDSAEGNDTVSTGFLGTVGYVSPEQAMGLDLEPRSDIFSLGVVLHEMLTGSAPFAGPTQWAVIESITRGKAPGIRETHPYVPESLDSLVQQMLAKDVSDRLSATAVLQALRRVPESALKVVTSNSETVLAVAPDVIPQVTRRVPARLSEVRSELASIAVLPLRTLSGDKDEAQIAEGLVAELTRALSGVPGISVASPLLSLRFKAVDTDITEMARSLKIQYLLTGSIQKAGNRVRVIAELDDTLSGLQLWSQSFDRTIEDFFSVQDELAHLMAAGVSGQVIRARAEHATVVPDEAADAMVLVRRVYHSLNTAYLPEALFEAVTLLRRATQLEPKLALAHAFLGFFLSQLFINNISTAVEADRTDAYRSVQTALRLAPGDPEVLENCGIVLIHCGKHAQAEQTLRRSVELASINLVAWGYLGLYLGWSGETEAQIAEAHAVFDRILKTAPDHPSLPYWLYFKGGIYARQGWNEKALEYCARSVSLQPSFPASLLEYSNALGKAGRFEEAIELAQQVAVLNPRGSQDAYMRELLITTGSRERAETHISGLVTAGIFQGDLQWPVLNKPDHLLERASLN